MKLPIKKRYFDLIKSGRKKIEYREAHITFVCEETKEEFRVEVPTVFITERALIPRSAKEVIKEKYVIAFNLKSTPKPEGD